MGTVGKLLSGLLGGGSTPKVNTAPADSEVATQAAKDQNARSALLETAGGQAGSPLQPGQVQQRSTLFGN